MAQFLKYIFDYHPATSAVIKKFTVWNYKEKSAKMKIDIENLNRLTAWVEFLLDGLNNAESN